MHQILQQSVMRLLSPLVRLLLRHGVSHAEFANWAKQAFVWEAEKNFGVDDHKKPTVSRIAVVTGINRKEVKRIQDLPEEERQAPSHNNRAARVVTGWLQDTSFHDADGKPAALRYGETDQGFNLLVRRYSGDVPARAILDELIRVGTVARADNDQVTLLQQGYVPHESKEEMIRIVGESAADLFETLDHNLASAPENSRFQLSVAYDNISADSLRQFKKLSKHSATELLKELDKFLASHDQDLNDENTDDGRYRAGLGIYLIEENLETDTRHE
ncbi:MAG: hypothetical protein KTR33_10320 [Gammaproteobacteria bacterium]|nr:hypothetical protein [Gammaproteobacteria bacterium]